MNDFLKGRPIMNVRTIGIITVTALVGFSTTGIDATTGSPRTFARPMLTHGAATGRASVSRGRATSGAPCAENNSDSFVGIPGVGNVAGGSGSSVTSGTSNLACEADSGIVAGTGNVIETDGNSAVEYSFIGAGENNTTDAADAFVGAGSGNSVTGAYGFVGSGQGNEAEGPGSFVGAGGTASATTHNVASGQDSFVGAGDGNVAAGALSFIGAGSSNTVTSAATYSSVVGGSENTVSGEYSGILGGLTNTASGEYSAIGGGNRNTASGEYSVVLGGYGNVASGAYGIVVGGDANRAVGTLSLAGGYHASAGHSGSFVWSDYVSGSAVASDTAINQFVVRASGGTEFYSNEAETSGVLLSAGSGTWASLSDRNAKRHVVPVDDRTVLEKLTTVPVSTWSYNSEAGVRHLGPMAQDFYRAFGIGADDRHITSIDEDGVAIAAIKALSADARRKDREYRSNAARITALEREMHRVESELAR